MIRTFALGTLAATIASAGMAAGYKTDTLTVDHRTTDLPLFVWYPTDTSANDLELGKNAVFPGVPVAENAAQSTGEYPLVLLSHGSGGNAVNIAWFAAHLADQGYIVAATNHPNTTSGNSIPAETVKVWERTQDMTAILDHIEAGGFNGLSADISRTAAIGFSLGGHTAMALGGAKVVRDNYAKHCDALPDLHDCEWFADAGVDLWATNQDLFEQSHQDPRVKTVVAIDPALSQAYDAESLTQMNIPVQLVNLGDPETIPVTINGQTIMKSLPNAEYVAIPEAWHFSFLGECTMLGHAIISVAGDDPICTETGSRARSDLHTEIAANISRFLRDVFSTPAL